MDIERTNMTITLTGTFTYTLLFTNCYITKSMKQNSSINYSLLYIYPYKQTSFIISMFVWMLFCLLTYYITSVVVMTTPSLSHVFKLYLYICLYYIIYACGGVNYRWFHQYYIERIFVIPIFELVNILTPIQW